MDLIEPRTGMQHIDRDDCLALLAQHQQGVGRLALVEGGKPVIMPVNYAMVEDRIVFLTAPGVKLDAAWRASSVAFEIDEIDRQNRIGWSVVVRGRAEVVTSKSQLFMLGATSLQPFVAGKEHWVMIHPDTITGRRVPFYAEFTL